MTKRQALRVAADCITEIMKSLAIDSNMYIMGDRMTSSVRAHERYQQLAKALRVIEDEILGQGVLEI